jgi:hypothetical protein
LDPAQGYRRLDASLRSGSRDSFAGRKPGIAGGPDRVVDQSRRHVDLGWTMLLVDFFGRDIREPASLFADRVSHMCATDHDPVANPRPAVLRFGA